MALAPSVHGRGSSLQTPPSSIVCNVLLSLLTIAVVCVVAVCSTTAAELEAAANQLLAMCQAGLPAPVSYNVVMTRSFLLMVPRRQEMCGRAAIK